MRSKTAQSQSPWQPINTAPVDGTVLLVRTRKGCHLACHVPGEPEGWMEQSGAYMLLEDTTGLPSHWIPLPSLPNSD